MGIKGSKHSTKRQRPSGPPYHSISHVIRRMAPIPDDSITLLPTIQTLPTLNALPLPKPKWQLMQPNISSCSSSIYYNVSTAASCPYLALGEASGQVTIYATSPRLLPIATIETQAYQREINQQPPSPNIHQYLRQKRTWENAIHAIQIQTIHYKDNRHGNDSTSDTATPTPILVLASQTELECWNVTQQTLTWTLPLEEDTQQCHQLHLHPNTAILLASFRTNTAYPIWAISPSGVPSNIIPRHADTQETMIFHTKCTALWDATHTNTTRCLLVGSVAQLTYLVLLQFHTKTILQYTVVPHKMMKQVNVESLQQSPRGTYTLLGTTRGVRLLDTETLTTIQVYGDQLALHGHSVIWQGASFLTKSTGESTTDESKWMLQESVWIVGVPSAHRPPTELQNVLHLWDIGHGKHAAKTVLGPDHKSGGFQSLIQCDDTVIASVQSGSCYALQPTCLSDFAGIMYPPGYLILDDNLEYLEDEDECDDVVDDDIEDDEEEVSSDDEDDDDDDLAKAMRLSMAEQDAVEAELVNILHHSPPLMHQIPCIPYSTLKQRLEEGTMSAEPSYSLSDQPYTSFVSNILNAMPHLEVMRTAKNKPCTKEEVDAKVTTSQTLRQKRTKAATLETLRKASLNPVLRKIMIKNELWTEGKGSSIMMTIGESIVETTLEEGATKNDKTSDAGFDESGLVPTVPLLEFDDPLQTLGIKYPTISNMIHTQTFNRNEDSTFYPIASTGKAHSGINCMACQGRWVIHVCGNRSIPVDYDELQRAEEEQKFKEKEELKKVRAAKRKVADAKRRIMKKKKRSEDEALRHKGGEEQHRFLEENRKREAEYRRQYPQQNKEKRRAEMLERLQHTIDDELGVRLYIPPSDVFPETPLGNQTSNETHYQQFPSVPSETTISSTYAQPSDVSYPKDPINQEQMTNTINSTLAQETDLQPPSYVPKIQEGETSHHKTETEYDYEEDCAEGEGQEMAKLQTTYEQESYSNAELLQAATYTTDNTTSYSNEIHQDDAYANDNSTCDDTAYTPSYHGVSHAASDQHDDYHYDHTPYSKTCYATPNSAQSDAIDALAALACAATSRSFESSDDHAKTPIQYSSYTVDANESYQNYHTNTNYSGTSYSSSHHESWGYTQTEEVAGSEGTNGWGVVTSDTSATVPGTTNKQGAISFHQ